MVHVIKKMERPDPALVQEFSRHASATIHEAYGRKGYFPCRIRPIADALRLCGPALTVQCPPGDNMMIHKALEMAEPNDILVVDTGGAWEYGYFGGLMATSAIARRVGGLVIDGCIRDSAEIIQKDFPVFSRGFCIRGTGKGTLGLINYPIFFDGLKVYPGDLIVGDDDGLVVVRREDCEQVLIKANERVEKEIIKEKALATGVSSVVYNKFDSIFQDAGLVEE